MGDFIFWGGKHKGKSLQLVEKTDPQYVAWVRANAPNLLKEQKVKKEIVVVKPQEIAAKPKMTLEPNLDFLKQKGDKL
jgi:hypothetical protein